MTGRATSRRTSDLERALVELSGDPLLAEQEGVPARVIVWDARIARVLYASEAAADFRARVADPSGRVRLDRPARDRLTALAGGLATRDRFRLDLVRLDRFSPATLMASRRLDVAGGPVLLSVIVNGAPAIGRTLPGLGATPRPPPVTGEPPVATIEPDIPAIPVVPETPQAVTGIAMVDPPARASRRFLWSTDAAGRITSVSQGLAAAIGAEHADIVGRSFAELADRTILDPMGTIARHLASGRAWQDVEVAWRMPEPGCIVPVTLGAMPVRSPDGAMEGYRGSGLVRLPEMARLGAERRTSRDRAALEVATSAPADTSMAPGEPGTTLSFSERGALHEIARALGGRFDLAAEEPATDRASAEIIALPSLPSPSPASPGPASPSPASPNPPSAGARPREPDPLALLDRLPVGIAVFRGETPIYLNATLLAWLGYADLAEIVAHGAVQGLSGAQDGPASTVLATRSGSSVDVEAEGTAIAWGELPARLVTVTRRPEGDGAAELKAAELELAAARARHATLTAAFDLAGIGAATLDDRGRVLWLNGPAERQLGYHEREIAGEAFTALLARESRGAVSGLLERLRSDADAAHEESPVVARLRDGREVPLLVRGTQAGADTILVWREASADTGAETASEPLPPLPARVLARVSHEILTPANAIVGVAGQMLDERPGPTGERDRTQLRDIARSGEQVAALATDLLDLSEMASGSGHLAPTRLDLNGLVTESVARLQPAASRERVVVRTSLRPDLEPVVADERSIRQIAFSVLSHAIRDTGAGGQVIVSTARTERGETAFRVRDTGGRTPSPAVAPEPAGGAPDAVRDPTGELSLPLSQALAEANRATFRVASDGVHGTLVEVVFPMARDAAE